ncbi:MAG: hypothetical protein HN348_21840 [Proteobacteria bacterium]|nr:hypothetical protein [Pseudomonadota bacterium]
MDRVEQARAYFDRNASEEEILVIHKNLVDSWSNGEVTNPELLSRTGRPERGGLLCQKIFGPIEDWCCACGALQGVDNEGLTCERCGVTCVTSAVRNTRLGHFSTTSLLHPSLVEAVAQVLGLTAKEVLALANLEAYLDEEGQVVFWPGEEEESQLMWICDHLDRCRVGFLYTKLQEASPEAMPEQLRSLGYGPSDLITRAIPILPPGQRPLLPSAGGLQTVDHHVEALLPLITRTKRLNRLMELDSPWIILANEFKDIQQLFEPLFSRSRRTAEIHGHLQAGWDGFAPCSNPQPLDRRPYDFDYYGDPQSPIAAVFRASHQSLLVQLPFVLVEVDLNGQAQEMIPTRGTRLQAVSKNGRYGLFRSQMTVDHFVFDFDRGEWLDAFPADFPVYVVTEDNEDTVIVECSKKSVRQLKLDDYPLLAVSSPCNRYCWVADKEEGGIFELSTGKILLNRLPYVDPEAGIPCLVNGRLVEWDDLDDEDVECLEIDPALVLTVDDEWRVFDGSCLFFGREPVMLLLSGDVVCFDSEGARLFVLDGDQLTILDLTEAPRVEKLVALKIMGVGFHRRPSTIKEGQWLALFESFGHLNRVLAATDRELLAVYGVGPKTVSRLRAEFGQEE